MAYIQPSGKIELMAGVPLTPAQQDTIYFASKSLQTTYFSGKVVKTLTAQSYTRIGPGRCRIAGQAELLNTCNYMRFNNDLPSTTPGSTRDYYAFITAVDWINPNVVEIAFQIDDIQTYLFDYTLGECFIERQHAESDGAGYNTEPEPVEIGDYLTNAVDYTYDGGTTFIAKDTSDYCYLMGITTMTFANLNTGNQTLDALFGANAETGLYGATRWLAYNIDDYSLIQTHLNILANLANFADLVRVQSLYIVPWRAFLSAAPTVSTATVLNNTVTGKSLTVYRPLQFWNDRLTESGGVITGHYTPQNNKLYTSPYMFFDVYVGGQSFRGRFEDSGVSELARLLGSVTVDVTGYVGDKPYIVVSLINYDREGVTEESTLIYSDFPSISMNVNGVEGQLVMGALQGLQTYLNAQISGTQLMAPTIHGLKPDWQPLRGHNTDITPLMAKPSSVSTGIYRPIWKLGIKSRQIRIEKAKEIDEFLSKYGYAQNKVGTPNTNARLNWTYVKTRGCIVLGSIPSQAREAIAKAFDNGITWWKDGAKVGNYGTNMVNPTL